MATLKSDRNILLHNAASRTLNSSSSAILLSASTPAFHITIAGANDPASITFTASLISLEGIVSFAVTGGTLTTAGNVATLTYANMPGSTASVMASITVNGTTFTSNPCVVTKVFDGATGGRGSGSYYGSGSIWADATADAATPGSNILDDVVTIRNGTTFAETRRWDGAAWVLVPAAINGSQLTNDSIIAAMLKAGILDVSKFAAGIEPVTMVTTVPTTKSTSTVFNTADGKLYRWNGTIYISTVPTTDLSGTLTSAQIADLAATKLTGQIVTTQITDSAISSPKIITGAVIADKIAAGAITAEKISVGMGRNLLRFSTFPLTFVGWVLESNSTGQTPGYGKYVNNIFNFNNEVAWLNFGGTPGAGTFTTLRQTELIGVTGGKWYEASAYVQTHRCKARLVISWFDVAGAFIAGSNVYGGFADNTNRNGNDLALYVRSWLNVPAPSTACFAAFYIQSDYDGAQSNPHTWFLRGFFGESNPNQGTPSAWSPAGVTQIEGGQITAEGITSREIATDSIIAGKIAAGAISAREIAAGAITTEKLAVTSRGAALNADPNCEDSTAWEYGAGTITFITVADGVAGNRAIRSSASPVTSFPRTKSFPMAAGKVYRVQGRFRSTGGAVKTAYFRVERANSSGAVISDQTGYENVGVPNAWTTWEKIFVAETGTTSGKISFALNWNGVNDGSVIDVQDVRLEEVLPGTLIQDGAITTNKITANSISTEKLIVGSVGTSTESQSSYLSAPGTTTVASVSMVNAGTGKVIVLATGHITAPASGLILRVKALLLLNGNAVAGNSGFFLWTGRLSNNRPGSYNDDIPISMAVAISVPASTVSNPNVFSLQTICGYGDSPVTEASNTSWIGSFTTYEIKV